MNVLGAGAELHVHHAPREKSLWNPPRAAAKFIGRAADVAKLGAILKDGARIAVVGPGGMGKTAFCAAAIDTHATGPENLGAWPAGVFTHDYYIQPSHATALAGLCTKLSDTEVPDAQRAAFVVSHLNRPDALLYLEGCEKADDLRALLRLIGSTTVLLTSRHREDARDAHLIDLQPLPREDAARLLFHYATGNSQPWPPIDPTGWETVAEKLGGHPLALRLAGQYIRIEQETLAGLQRLMEKAGFPGQVRVESEREDLAWLFDRSAAAVEAHHPGALGAWYVLSLHALAPLPLAPIAASLGIGEDEARERLRGLVLHSLAEREEMPAKEIGQTEPGWRLSHALLAEWGREALPTRHVEMPAIYPKWRDWWFNFRRGSLLNRSVRGGHKRYSAFSPHFGAVLTGIRIREGESSRTFRVALADTGTLIELHSDLSEAETYMRQALRLSEADEGVESSATLINVCNLAHLLMARCDFPEAESLYARANEARLRVLGDSDLETLNGLNGLAEFYRTMGDLAKAEPLYRQALEGFEKKLGSDHSDTLTCLSNLAVMLHAKGDLAGAESLYRRALEMREQCLGCDHRYTLDSVNNLAVFLQERGDYAHAQILYQRALKGLRALLGNNHQDTLNVSHNLALGLKMQGDLTGAEALFRQTLEVAEESLGAVHQITLNIVNNLALVLKSRGDFVGAEPLYRRALEGRRRLFGEVHAKTLESVNNLGALYYATKDFDKGEPLLRQALDGRQRLLGNEHKDTLQSVNNLGGLMYAKGNLQAAEVLMRRALAGNEKLLGAGHPDTCLSALNLANVLLQRRSFPSARLVAQQALRGFSKSLPENHPYVQDARQLVEFLSKQR